MTLRIEPARDFGCAECERKLVKVYEPGFRTAFMLLCPRCDRDMIEEMGREASELPTEEVPR